MNELKELLIKAFNLELDDSQDAEPDTYLFNWEYDVTDALNTAMQLIEQFTTRKELEARIDELSTVVGNSTRFCDVIYCARDRITQLSTKLTNKEMK